jgi:allophanate hydrolase subunit 1
VTGSAASAVTLRALGGRPLLDVQIRSMVEATAHALAERQGVKVLEVATTPSSVTVKVAADRIVAIGLAAELRRVTGRWYAGKFGADCLWGRPPEEGEEWKRA